MASDSPARQQALGLDGKVEPVGEKTPVVTQRSATRALWIIGGSMLAIQALLILAVLLFLPPSILSGIQQGGTVQPNPDNYLPTVGTIAALAFGFLLGFLGLKRLEQFDSELAAIRRDLTNELVQDRQQMNQEATRTYTELDRRQTEFMSSLSERAANAVANELAEREERLAQRIVSFEAAVESNIRRIEESLEPYAWLEERKGEVDYLVGVRTVGAARLQVRELLNENKIDMAIRIVEYVIENELPGSANDYHNLATTLAAKSLHDLAAVVLDQGMKKFPADVDLIADAIDFNVDLGDLDAAEEAFRRLERIEQDRWNWRAYVFSANLLFAGGRPDEARELYRQFRERVPGEERAYSSEGSYLLQVGKYKEARDLLEEALEKCNHVPQSASTLADVYLELGDYRAALKAADRAIESTYDEQPRTNQQAVSYQRAAAADGLIHQLLRSQPVAVKELDFLVPRCVRDYRVVGKLKAGNNPYYVPRASDRLKLLEVDLHSSGLAEEQVLSWLKRGGIEVEKREALSGGETPDPTGPREAESGGGSSTEGELDLGRFVEDIVAAMGGDESARSRVDVLVHAMSQQDGLRALAQAIAGLVDGTLKDADIGALESREAALVRHIIDRASGQ